MEEVIAVPERHRFDSERLREYLTRALTVFQCAKGQLTVKQFKHGESNPTFLLRTDGGQQFVLRKRPTGKLLPGAHRMDREHLILSVLYSTGFPVPCPLLYCSNTSIIGTDFYIMEFVQGRIFKDIRHLPAAEQQAIVQSIISTLAQLHGLDWEKLGLTGYGRKGDYCERQVSVWINNYKAACMGEKPIEEMAQLMEWLPNNLPPPPQPLCIVHGDFKLDNIIFHPTEPRVIAVLDWELSTIGHPIVDLAHMCVFSSIGTFSLPDESILTKLYAEQRSLSLPLPHWDFSKALTCFRIAAIMQGVYSRSIMGNASSNQGKKLKTFIQPLAAYGCSIIGSTSPTASTVKLPNVLNFINYSNKARATLLKLKAFMKEHVYPVEEECYKHVSNPDTMWTIPPVLEQLKKKAREEGLWNLFLPGVSGFSQLDYAPMAEEMGRCPMSSEVFNCSAPDTGNMEVLHLYGSEEQKRKWLQPLLDGKIRSCFGMSEPAVASSDATNMELSIRRDGNEYVVNGRKWWSSGAGDPRCTVAIVMGVTNPDADRMHRHSMILVPFNSPGVKKVRPLSVFGYYDAPHGHLEVEYDNVRVPASNLILGEGRGFEIAQGRLGPGRIHHCMRMIGMAERSLEMMCQRSLSRKAFGKRLALHQTVRTAIADSRMEIDQCRLLVLSTAYAVDTVGSKEARKQIAEIKVAVAQMTCRVIDRAIQVHGAMGVCQDSMLPHFYAGARSLRIADGPDIVHMETVAKEELKEKAKL